MTYEFDEDGGSFKKDFPHLYNRIRNLQDMIVSYCRSGKLYAVLPYGMSAEDTPRIRKVTFEEALARGYEKTAEEFFSGSLPKGETSVPKPKFAVTLEADFRFGMKGVRMFDFRAWSEESLTEFCREMKIRSDEAFRRGFRPMG